MTGFSMGSGRLRTVSALAGMSDLSSWIEPFRRLSLRRYQRKAQTARARKMRDPIIPPARAPLPTPLEAELVLEPGETHLTVAQVLQSRLMKKHCWLGAQLQEGVVVHCMHWSL